MVYIYNSHHKHGVHESKFNVKLHTYISRFFYYKSLYYGYIYVRKRELLSYTSKTVKEEGGLAYHRVHTFYENCLKFSVVLTNLNHGGFFARGNLPLPFFIGQ